MNRENIDSRYKVYLRQIDRKRFQRDCQRITVRAIRRRIVIPHAVHRRVGGSKKRTAINRYSKTIVVAGPKQESRNLRGIIDLKWHANIDRGIHAIHLTLNIAIQPEERIIWISPRYIGIPYTHFRRIPPDVVKGDFIVRIGLTKIYRGISGHVILQRRIRSDQCHRRSTRTSLTIGYIRILLGILRRKRGLDGHSVGTNQSQILTRSRKFEVSV